MVSVEHLSIEFSSRPILDDVTFLINPRDRIALVGKNGAGKTTLLRLLAGVETPTAGRISKMGDLTIGYLPQVMMHVDGKTLREDVMSVYSSQLTTDIGGEARFIAEMDRTIIGLGFERKDFDRPCSEFSGGWRMRIELAKILLQHPDLLLLDEPTNHLDMPSAEALENAILAFDGTVVAVSHDRYFINRIATRIIELAPERDGGMLDYYLEDGDDAFAAYVELREKLKQESNPSQAAKTDSASKLDYEERKRENAKKRAQEKAKERAEAEIKKLEAEIEELDRELFGEAATNYLRAAEIDERKSKIEERLLELYEIVM